MQIWKVGEPGIKVQIWDLGVKSQGTDKVGGEKRGEKGG